MTTGHDAAMFGSRKGGNIFGCNCTVFQLSIAALQTTPQRSSFKQPLILLLFHGQDCGKAEQWGFSVSPASAG